MVPEWSRSGPEMVPRGKARGADVFAGAKGMCLRQGASRSEVEGGEDGRSPTGRVVEDTIGRSRCELQDVRGGGVRL